MSVEIGLWGVAILMGLLVLRLPVALALIIVSFGGIWAMIGWNPAMGILSNTPYSFAAKWTMSAVPMFLLMGFIAYHTGLTGGLFEAAKALLARLPGGLAISSVFACSGFAAVSGSSLACAAAMGALPFLKWSRQATARPSHRVVLPPAAQSARLSRPRS